LFTRFPRREFDKCGDDTILVLSIRINAMEVKIVGDRIKKSLINS
jgi:hypothetical protein